MQRELPILFNDQMVRAILAPIDPKTETRRPMKPQPADRAAALNARPPARPGDRLWVREAFRLRADQDHKPPSQDWWKSGAWYEADGPWVPSGCGGGCGKLRPSIHMPRWASRITLPVVEVRGEQLLDITEEGAKREGFEGREHFLASWRGIYAEPSVNSPATILANPWVWVTRWSEAEVRRG